MTSMCSSAPSTLLKGSKHMAFNVSGHGPASGRGRHQAQAEINMVPLIDVMLVLLIIFMVTAPLLTHAVKVQLPQLSSTKNEIKPDTVTVSIQADGALHWNSDPIQEEDLEARLQAAATVQPMPELHIRADESVAYKKVAWVMSASAKAGLSKIGFVSQPKANPSKAG